MKQTDEKKAEAPKPGGALPDETLDGAAGGSDETASGPDVKDESNSDILQRMIGLRWDR